MSLTLIAEGAPLVVIIMVATFGIYSHHFQDNLLQRVGMSVLAFGAVLKLTADVTRENGHAACSLMIYGAAIYAAGCVFELVKNARKP